MTMTLRGSSTCTWQFVGKKRPTLALPIAASFSGTPRFSISGQIFEAPKFEKSHQRISGLALIAPRAHGQPTPATASDRTIKARNARRMRARKRSLLDRRSNGLLLQLSRDAPAVA